MAGGVTPILPALSAGQGWALRRDLLLVMLRREGALRITKPLAAGLGLRRKALRREIDRMIDDGVPLRWLADGQLALREATSRIVFDLDESELGTLVVALRHTREGAHTRSQVSEAAHILHRLAAQLLPALFERLQSLGQFEVLPQVVGEDGRPSTRIRNLVVRAAREERKMTVLYTSAEGVPMDRVIWPLMLTHHESCVLCWCELRGDFRTFRLDRLAAPELSAEMIPKSREALLTEWRGRAGREPG